ncbi:MAG: hypothetical protein ACRYGA_02340 [Janthinobacterium lividum]
MGLLSNVSRFVDKKLQVYGRTFMVVRPIDAGNPLSNEIGTTLAYPYRNPKGHGDADWMLMIGEDVAQEGDYLIGADETYFYARRSHLLPAQAIRCNHTVALLRPAPISGVGAQPYGGLCMSEATATLGVVGAGGALTAGWPASILIGGRQAAGSGLPMSVASGGFEVMLPKTVPVVISASDILLDNLGRRFIADTCEISEMGWRLTVKEAHV